MTTTAQPAVRTPAPAPVDAPPREGAADSLLERQLRAIDALNEALRAAEAAASASTLSREMRMDLARRAEVLRRQHDAVVARTHEHLKGTAGASARSTGRVVLAHRNAWFLDRVAAVLDARGLQVVARLNNGADAIGLALCDQPELVLVEDTLAMVPGVEVVRALRELCPQTRVVAQCGYGERVGPLLDAGAEAVYTRQVPPRDVAEAMARLLD